MKQSHSGTTIGFQTLSLYGSYYKSLLQGIRDEAELLGINVIFFPGRCSPYPARYEYQNTLIYNFMTRENIDGLIITPGSMVDLIGLEKARDFYSGITDIPLVSLNMELPGQNISVIGINNQSGFQQLMVHLFEVHGFKKPVFINGPEENVEARQRFQVFREALEKSGIPFSEKQRFFGNFTPESGYAAVREFFDIRRLDCDVIVASNDSMALGVLEELSRRGINVPEDIAVSGFDNLTEGATSIPSLTTVGQPLEKQARQAVQTLVAMINGQNVEKQLIFDTTMVVRKSCGCTGHTLAEKEWDEFNQEMTPLASNQPSSMICQQFRDRVTAFSHNLESERIILRCCDLWKAYFNDGQKKTQSFLKELNCLFYDYYLSPVGLEIMEIYLGHMEGAAHFADHRDNDSTKTIQTLQAARKLLAYYKDARQAEQLVQHEKMLYRLRFLIRDSSAFLNFDQFQESLYSSITSIGIENFYIVLYDAPIKNQDDSKKIIPQKLQLLPPPPHTSLRNKAVDDPQFTFPKLLPLEALPKEPGFQFIMAALYFREEQYGYVLMDYKNESFEAYEIVATQISTTYKRWLMMKEITDSEQKLRSALDELQSYTHHLQNISERDELTALYNRRGFLSLASASLEAANKQKHSSIIFFFDLDGLKAINDNNGHDEGDFALKKAALILQNSFRSSDILGRLGGDEFVVFSPNVDPKYINTVIERIAKKTEMINKTMDKAFRVSMSFGWAINQGAQDYDLNRLLQTADNMLYKNKKARKKKAEK